MKFLTVLIVMVLNLAFAEDSGAISKDRSNIKSDQALQSNAQKDSMLKIVKVEPTVLFRKEKDGLMQAVDITIENSCQTVDAGLQVKFRSYDGLSINLGTIKAGKENYRFFVPEVTGTMPVEFALVLSSKVQDRLSMTWPPRLCLVSDYITTPYIIYKEYPVQQQKLISCSCSLFNLDNCANS